MKYNKKKSLEVLHYLIEKVGSRANVGKTVLYKLLYFSDFGFFELYEKYLIGETYKKYEHGPVPCHFDDVVKELEETKKIKSVKSKFFGYGQHKYISLKEPELNSLSAQELRVIDRVIERFGDLSASKISDLSHKDIPWEATEDNEIIDYKLVFYREPELSFGELS